MWLLKTKGALRGRCAHVQSDSALCPGLSLDLSYCTCSNPGLSLGREGGGEGGGDFPQLLYEHDLWLLSQENRSKIQVEPTELPSCSILHTPSNLKSYTHYVVLRKKMLKKSTHLKYLLLTSLKIIPALKYSEETDIKWRINKLPLGLALISSFTVNNYWIHIIQ